MILVDSSVWIDYFRLGDAVLAGLLGSNRVLTHPFVIGELALGNLRARDSILRDLRALPKATAASDLEVSHMIESWKLYGLGIGYVDVHLLAATRLTQGAALWTRDKRLDGVAHRIGLAAGLGAP